MTAARMPKLLRASPLRLATFEVRFSPAMDSAGEVLPGMLFSSLQKNYKRVEPSGLVNLPQRVRDEDENLRFAATHTLVGEDARIGVSGRSLTVVSSSYHGWQWFRERIEEAIRVLHGTNLIETIERFSCRYISLLADDGQSGSSLGKTTVQILFGGKVPVERGLHARFELDREAYRVIVNVLPDGRLQHPGSELQKGLIIDVDAINLKPRDNFLESPSEEIDGCHDIVKNVFFELLTEATVSALGPEYDE